jgi:hypothetical protein
MLLVGGGSVPFIEHADRIGWTAAATPLRANGRKPVRFIRFG